MIPPLFDAVRSDLLEAIGFPERAIDGCNVAIIVGPNAIGKSLLRRAVRVACEENDIRCYDFSQEARTRSGFASAMIYGDESYTSTGTISAHVIQRAFEQKPDEPFLFVWDEPEIGLSEESQLGVVKLMRKNLTPALRRKPPLLGIVFMTHSRTFAKAWADYKKLAFVDLEKRYATLDEWLSRVPEPADIEQLTEDALKRFRHINAMLKDKQ